MSSYFSLQLKKVTKHNLSIISVVILSLISFGLLYMKSTQLSGTGSLKGDAQGQIAMKKEALQADRQALKRYSPQGKSYKATEKDIKQTEKELKKDQAFVDNINHNHWKRVYETKLKRDQKGKLTDLSSDEKDGHKSVILRLKYLIAHPMPYESDSAVTGIQFLLDLNENYLPVLFSLVMIFVLTYLFTGSYKNGLNISTVLPINRLQSTLTNNIVGLLVVSFIFLLLNLLVFGGAASIFGTGRSDYPYIIHHLVNDHLVPGIIPTAKLLPQAAILQLLNFIFMVLFVQLAAKIFHNQLPTLLVSLLLLLGGHFITIFIIPLEKIAQWLPGTYLGVLNVVSNQTAYAMDNSAINFSNGVFTLILSSILLFLLVLLIDRITTIAHRNGRLA
ncbi:hypothetical protein JF76_13360 [Lactobacillus kullabergensis]|uniref:Uncharacterized protein n=1 Tax=Lactobacillus kullabergensis TaxID=1218493 RepID=A0A0F4L8P2_9LACO|nr:hypothetical protein [Lactobacillus kullabergensis]KJY54965.1 hypothetical protein JF76_13360 [Lactobacillus kullabergensis]